jgi:hypothetical protein
MHTDGAAVFARNMWPAHTSTEQTWQTMLRPDGTP